MIQGEREHTGGIHMNWSIVANVILVILLILVVVLAVLYFLGRKMEKRQVEQQSAIDAAKQTVSLMAIDKKKLKKAGLNSLRLYASGQNLLYFWGKSYRGINPEARVTTGSYSSPLVNGYQRGGFPIQSTVNIGFELNF